MDKIFGMFKGNAPSAATSAPPAGAVTDAKSVVLHTTLGDITIALYSAQTPRVSTHNFVILGFECIADQQ